MLADFEFLPYLPECSVVSLELRCGLANTINVCILVHYECFLMTELYDSELERDPKH